MELLISYNAALKRLLRYPPYKTMFVTLALSVCLFIVGGFYSVINWIIFFHNLKPNSKYSSFIPFLGGICLFSAFWLLDLEKYSLLGLCIDFSCFPQVIYLILRISCKYIKHIIKCMVGKITKSVRK